VSDTHLDSEIHVIVDDLSWRDQRRSVDSNGIYKITYRDLFDVYTAVTGKDEADFWQTLDAVGLDNRWFRLSDQLYEAACSWIDQGRRVTDTYLMAA